MKKLQINDSLNFVRTIIFNNPCSFFKIFITSIFFFIGYMLILIGLVSIQSLIFAQKITQFSDIKIYINSFFCISILFVYSRNVVIWLIFINKKELLTKYLFIIFFKKQKKSIKNIIKYLIADIILILLIGVFYLSFVIISMIIWAIAINYHFEIANKIMLFVGSLYMLPIYYYFFKLFVLAEAIINDNLSIKEAFKSKINKKAFILLLIFIELYKYIKLPNLYIINPNSLIMTILSITIYLLIICILSLFFAYRINKDKPELFNNLNIL